MKNQLNIEFYRNHVGNGNSYFQVRKWHDTLQLCSQFNYVVS